MSGNSKVMFGIRWQKKVDTRSGARGICCCEPDGSRAFRRDGPRVVRHEAGQQEWAGWVITPSLVARSLAALASALRTTCSRAPSPPAPRPPSPILLSRPAESDHHRPERRRDHLGKSYPALWAWIRFRGPSPGSGMEEEELAYESGEVVNRLESFARPGLPPTERTAWPLTTGRNSVML